MKRLLALLRRAGRTYRSEGLLSLLGRGYAFVSYRLFQYRTYYLYADPVDYDSPLNEAEFRPDIDDLATKVVSSNEEADELEAQGFDFRSYVRGARARLDKGALAHCIFVGKELAHIGWVALSQQAMDSLEEPPYAVDFSKKEAVGTSVWSNPKYRRKGLQKYGGFLYFSVLRKNGILVRRSTIRKNNIPSLKVRTEFSAPPYAEGRYLRILWWKSWREKPFAPQQPRAERPPNG